MGLRDVALSVAARGVHCTEALCAAVYYDNDSVGALFTLRSHAQHLFL